MSRLLAAGLLALLLSTLSACSVASPEETRYDRLESLEQELQPLIAELMGLGAGLYSEIQIYGFITAPGQIDGAPDGQVAVLTYSYTFAESMSLFDWRDRVRSLEGQAARFDEVCESDVLPAIREAGIEGPLGVEYFYRNGPGSPANDYWRHWCWSEE